MMRLKISDAADQDIDRIFVLGARTYGERQAINYIFEMRGEFREIVAWPLLARERHEVRPPVRLRVFHAHNIFYDIRGDVVEIVRVLHHSADWVHLL